MTTQPRRQRAYFGVGRWTERVISAIHAQQDFLDTVARIEPRVLSQLSAAALPSYQSLVTTDRFLDRLAGVERDRFLHHQASGQPGSDTTPWEIIQAAPDDWLDMAALRDAILSWSVVYRLTETWILEVASSTLDAWTLGYPRDRWHYPGWWPMPRGNPFTFMYLPYDPRTAPDWPTWKNRAEDEFRRAINEYRKASELLVAETTPPTPFKDNLDHFEWLTHYQVQRESMSKMSQRLGLKRQSVQEAIHNTADLVGLTLAAAPTGRGGRPRKPSQDT